VASYRTTLMNYNEIYLRTEVEALRRYRSFYFGTTRVRDVDLPDERTFTLCEHYRAIDRILEPVVTRIGWRMEKFNRAAGLGRALSHGRVIGRASAYMFHVHGVSRALTRRLRALEPALIHAYTGVSGAHALPLARRCRIPLIVSFGGYDATASDEELSRWPQAGRILLRRRDAMKREVQLIITVSAYLRRQLLAKGWPADRTVVLHRGIDTDLFTPDGAPSLTARTPRVLAVGRLMDFKGTVYLIRAMTQVQREIPTAELIVAGAGPLRGPLESEARQLGVRAQFIGQVGPEIIRARQAEAQLYCMPSVLSATGQREGLSNALLEAMASGLPVVASDSGGIPEAVGDAGFLVPERDVAALAARIVALLSDATMRERMGAASRERVMRHFNLRRQIARLEDLYDEARRDYTAARANSGA
jgi:glycosyltransferase involved in cell wall biosynthesis